MGGNSEDDRVPSAEEFRELRFSQRAVEQAFAFLWDLFKAESPNISFGKSSPNLEPWVFRVLN